MSDESQLIVISASARAAVWSARQSGFTAFAIDQFGDVDLREAASRVCVVDGWPRSVLDAAATLPEGPFVFGGGLENSPELIEELASSRELLGCSAKILRLVRDPFWLTDCWRSAGLRVLRLLAGNAEPGSDSVWLRKSLNSAGGLGVRIDDGRPTGDDVLQEFVRGDVVSGLFLTNGGEVRLLGMSSQLVGRAEAGTDGFVYCGSIWPAERDDRDCVEATRSHAPSGNAAFDALPPSVDDAERRSGTFPRRAWERESQALVAGEAVLSAAGLVGLFGIDFVRDECGELWPIEVNPRYPASAEQCERSTGWPLMRWHVDACRSGRLPADLELAELSGGSGRTEGKIVVYSPRDMPAPDLRSLGSRLQPANAQLADIPVVGSPLKLGAPVCSILSSADGEAECREKLLKLAATLRSELATE